MQTVITMGTSSIVKGEADPKGVTFFAPAILREARPLPAKPAPQPEPQAAGLRRRKAKLTHL